MTQIVDRLSAALSGRYRIERHLGEGAMATVYLAEDLKHDRRVALKVLRPELAAALGADRFLQEIKTTASLQHPHILPLFDSGESDGLLYYVMPYVEGESLREKLDRETQLGIAEAVEIATEVADVLEYAHQQGVIHRDIKPENILLHGGRPMVADFGIALAVSHAGGARLTETGLSLGTPYYMSPEQATAERELTNRSDVYSLGAMLYEMLAGTPPHTASSAQQVIAKILTEEAEPLARVRKSVPPNVEAAVAKALEKLPADRFASAEEFARALGDPGFAPSTATVGRPAPWSALTGVLAVTTLLATALALWGWLRPSPRAPTFPPSRLAVLAPDLGGAATALQLQIALTPDGGTLIYTANTPEGGSRTMRMPLDATEPMELQGVVDFVADYVMSPDGSEFVGAVLSSRQLYRYSMTGGSSKPLPASLGVPMFGAYARDGSVWISDSDLDEGIARLGSDGAVSRPFGADSRYLIMMQVLPDDRSALVLRAPQGSQNSPPELLDLRTGGTTRLLDLPTVAVRYTVGHLVYCLPDGTLEAVPFDPEAGVVEGRPIQIARGVSMTGAAKCQLAVADNGTVAYIPEEPRSLVFLDRSGNQRLATQERRNFHDPRYSPDGRRVSVDFNGPDGRDVWVLDLDGGGLTRTTFDRDGHDATWSPDGRSINYTSLHEGDFGIFRTPLGSAEPPEALIVTPELAYTGTWLRDRDALVTVTPPSSESFHDIVLVLNGGHGPVEPLVATRFDESYPALSPDGRWLAYVSTQTGRAEVYVQRVDAAGEAVRMSTDGGGEPVFGPDGHELFYRSTSQLFVAELAFEPELAVTSRRPLFDVSDIATGYPHANYDLSPDGHTFVMVRLNPSSRVMVIQNLPALVARLSNGEVGR